MADPYTVAPQIQENILRTVLAIAAQQEAERERAANAPNLAAQADYYKALTSNTLANAFKQELMNRLTQGAVNAMGTPTDIGIGLPPLPPGGGALREMPAALGARIPNEQITQLLMSGALNPNDLLTMAGLQGRLPNMGQAAEIGLGMQPRAGEKLAAEGTSRGQDVAAQDNLTRFIGSVYSAFGKMPTAEFAPTNDDVKNAGSFIAAVLGKLAGSSTLEARALGPAQTVALINAYANFIGSEAQQLAAKASQMRGSGKDDTFEQAVRLFGALSTNMQALAGRASAAANVGDEDTARNATAAMFGLAKQANSVATALGLPTSLPEVASPKPAGYLERLFGGGGEVAPGFNTADLTPEQAAAIMSGQTPTGAPSPAENGKPARKGLPLPSTGGAEALSGGIPPTDWNALVSAYPELQSVRGILTTLPFDYTLTLRPKDQPSSTESQPTAPSAPAAPTKAPASSDLDRFLEEAPDAQSTVGEVDRWFAKHFPDIDIRRKTLNEKLAIASRLQSEAIRGARR